MSKYFFLHFLAGLATLESECFSFITVVRGFSHSSAPNSITGTRQYNVIGGGKYIYRI